MTVFLIWLGGDERNKFFFVGRGFEITLGVRVRHERSSGLAAGEENQQKYSHGCIKKHADTPIYMEVYIGPSSFVSSAQNDLRVIFDDLHCPFLHTSYSTNE